MIHEGMRLGCRCARVETLEAVRLPDPQRIMNSYPHQLSGGQQQRVVIAMALLSSPSSCCLTSRRRRSTSPSRPALSSSSRTSRRSFGTSMIYISHNLGLILETCDRICVMYSGQSVEIGTWRRCSTTCAIPIRAGCSPPFPCRAPTASRIRWCRSAASSPCRATVPRAAPSARAATSSWPGAAICRSRCRSPGDPASGALRALCRDRLAGAPPAGHRPAAAGPGKLVLEFRICRNITRSATIRSPPVRRKAPALRQSQREARFRGARGRDGRDRRRVGLREVHLRQGSDGPRGGDRRRSAPQRQGDRPPPVRKRAAELISLQIVFQNPFETLNPSHSVGTQIAPRAEEIRRAKDGEERRPRSTSCSTW